MLRRMYYRWAERRGYAVEELDLQEGEEAGIKSVSFAVRGPNAFGYLKAESGVHRLVRISPFDSNAVGTRVCGGVCVSGNRRFDRSRHPRRRLGSADDAIGRRWRPARQQDRKRGADHPQTERSRRQVSVRTIATQEPLDGDEDATGDAVCTEAARKEAKIDEANSHKKAIEWGSQIRSYVLAPYRLVTDHRSELKVGNVDAVLDGELDEFIKAYLIQAAG